MLPSWLVVIAGAISLGAAFAVAAWAERRCRAGRSVVANPYAYALSLCIFLTAWGFYGNVGLAARSGTDFLALHLGPTLMAVLGWSVLRKMIRITRQQRLASIADFISARYGKSALLGAVVALVALVGVTPYLALQLDGVARSYRILTQGLEAPTSSSLLDTGLWVALILALFTILFGARRPDAAGNHEGLVAAVVADSIFKLLAFLAVGLFVVYGIHDGIGDIYRQAAQLPQARDLFTIGLGGDYSQWMLLLLLSALAVFFLPRQFQVAVVENTDESHLRKALWLFPLYMLALDFFIVPIALAGVLEFGSARNPDGYVLALTLSGGAPWLALLAFLGGLSAATAMIIVETLALSTMLTQNLVMPLLLRIRALGLRKRGDLSRLILLIRRLGIIAALAFGYLFARASSGSRSLAETGMISFTAVAQFAPAILGGIFWKQGNRRGALTGLCLGVALWAWCLLVPVYTDSGLLDPRLLSEGPFGLAWLRPTALFGLELFDPLAHAVFWSLLVNTTCYVGFSLFSGRDEIERAQANAFVDALQAAPNRLPPASGPAVAGLADLYTLLDRTLGTAQARQLLHLPATPTNRPAPPQTVQLVEQALAGAMGAASAHLMVSAVIHQDPLRDPLSGLPNLPGFLSILSRTLAADTPLAVVFLNLSRFRVISHGLGPEAADALLVAVGRRLLHTSRPNDTVASLGGDQFAVLLAGVGSADAALQVAKELQQSLTRGVRVDGDEIYLSASVGVALPEEDVEAEGLLRNAELAMREARAQGMGGRALYEARMRSGARAELRLEHDLRRALEKEQFELHFQPVVALASGRLAGFEALVRWRAGDDRLIPPGDFLPLCEETGLIIPLGDWVARQACRQLAQWRHRYPEQDALTVSINLSARQFTQPDLPERVLRALADADLPPQAVKLEITESVLMPDAVAAHRIIASLRSHQLELTIDDFGTGYSSLSYLHRLPVSALKIDRSFVDAMEQDPRQASIVEATVLLASRLGLQVVAEGVASLPQIRRLHKLGADFGQGYYFSPPLSIADAEALLARPRRWAVIHR